MKILIVALSALLLTACAQPGTHRSSNDGYSVFNGNGVRMTYGDTGPMYSRPNNARELTKTERDYIAANQVDFGALTRANQEVNAESNRREEASLKANRPKLSCYDLVALVYQSTVANAYMTGDFEAVRNFDTEGKIKQCNKNNSVK